MTPAQLREIRCALYWTQDELAAEVGVSSGRTVRRWELGERKIPKAVAQLVRIMHDRESKKRRDLI